MNYANLIQNITENIKTNGRQAITAQVLQNVLVDMVGKLGQSGSLLGGVIDTSFVPNPTNDAQVVYIAEGPGTYTNFNGLVVGAGEVAFFYFDGNSWAKSSVDVLEVVNDLSSTATDKALSAAMGKQIGDDISQIGQELDGAEAAQITSSNQGKYIGYQGTLANGANFAYSDQFYASAGSVIVVTAKGYMTYVTMIAKVITEGTLYTPLVISIDSDVHTYTYEVTESGYYASSWGILQPHTIFVRKNTPGLLDERITTLENDSEQKAAEILSLDKKTTGALYQEQTFTETTGKFINDSGSIATSANYAYTSKFYVVKGQKIIVNARGYLTSIAMISKVVTENSSYTPLVVSTDSSDRSYEYTATESGYYAASYSTNASRSVYVSQNTPEMLDNRISELEQSQSTEGDKLEGISEQTLTVIAKETGKFISVSTNAPSSSASFKYSTPIFIKAGSLIILTARGYLTYVSMIARVVYDGAKYVNVCTSIDSTVREYRYYVENDGYYAFSWASAEGIIAKVVVYPTVPNLLPQDDLYCGVPVVGMIGDSLMSGAGYDTRTSSVHDNIDYAWWKVLERKSGMTYRRFCVGGMSTRSFITNATYGLPVALTSGNECNLYIIGLEINDRALGDSYLGQASDIDMADPDNNADTYYGNYARIIQKITAFNPGCKFILFTNPRTDGDFNDAIRAIAGMFSNCYLVDLWALYSPYFTAGGFFDKYKDSSAHYPAMAYQSMAKLLERAIDDCIDNNYADFKNIQYQG